ncbi:hypothetical protein GCM10025859_35400 [Alicyclobacillus fastidiosus]|nr:hypothetical protein GCM10025859_35400 [Alicyclobacillus fastidiosus]
MVYGEGERVRDVVAAIRASYDKDVTDEFVLPIIQVDDSGAPVGNIQEGDSLVFFNFRPDRAIQLSQAFTNDNFDGFDRGSNHPHVDFVSMVKFSDTVGGKLRTRRTARAIHTAKSCRMWDSGSCALRKRRSSRT